ncbi:MAG: Nucleoside phosphorylase [Candidatus Acidoferrum typicum]|nr:Nucleoside phosphorylase [Candidatus Acidoferrum typicum]
MKILVTFAVEAEFAPWRRSHSFDPVQTPIPIRLKSRNLYRGIVFGNNVDVLLTGIGWEASKTNRPSYILRELLKLEPDVCISSGLAGGLASDLQAGDVVAARALSLRTGGDVIHCNSNLVRLAEDAGARVKRMQVTEPHVISEASAKASLAAFADFVDMEGYYILQIASGTQVPAISVRAISDTHDDNLPSGIEKLVDREGHVQTLPLLKLLLRRPSQIPSLVDFGSKSKGAAVGLAEFLDRFLEVLDGDSSEAQAKQERVAAR